MTDAERAQAVFNRLVQGDSKLFEEVSWMDRGDVESVVKAIASAIREAVEAERGACIQFLRDAVEQWPDRAELRAVLKWAAVEMAEARKDGGS